jgi:hypothetical protein
MKCSLNQMLKQPSVTAPLRHERDVADAVDARDERADPESDPEQIKDGLEKPGEDHDPLVLVDEQVALHHSARAIPARKQDTQRAGHACSLRRKV